MSALVTASFVLVAVAIIAVAALALAGRWSPEGLSDASLERAPTALAAVPVGEATAADIGAIRLDQAVRGYRMDEVDAVIERLTEEIAERDRLLGRSGRGVDEPGAGPEPDPDPPAR